MDCAAPVFCIYNRFRQLVVFKRLYSEIVTRLLLFQTLFAPVFYTLSFQVNLEYLESKLESVNGEEVQRIQDNINSLFHHCVQALGEEHQIKVVNALQTLCALFRGVHQKNKSASGFDIINMLMGFDKAEQRMK
ncbi:Armadillo-like helical domain-containing protein 3, partial [Xenoophorus captivus]